MLTISQLAAYAGVTVRAVRHYHHIGLLPEPSRDGSGYRTYDAGDVVRLIRIRTLAQAGVPLARVQELLAATPEEFDEAVDQIDAGLRAQVRELQEHRRRIARLATGDSLALPAEVLPYLEKLRASGAPEPMVEGERDAWILMAARWPERIPEFMVDKMAQLDDPRMVQLNRLIGELLEVGMDEDRLTAMADLLAEMAEQSAERGELDRNTEEMSDDASNVSNPFVQPYYSETAPAPSFACAAKSSSAPPTCSLDCGEPSSVRRRASASRSEACARRYSPRAVSSLWKASSTFSTPRLTGYSISPGSASALAPTRPTKPPAVTNAAVAPARRRRNPNDGVRSGGRCGRAVRVSAGARTVAASVMSWVRRAYRNSADGSATAASQSCSAHETRRETSSSDGARWVCVRASQAWLKAWAWSR